MTQPRGPLRGLQAVLQASSCSPVSRDAVQLVHVTQRASATHACLLQLCFGGRLFLAKSFSCVFTEKVPQAAGKACCCFAAP